MTHTDRHSGRKRPSRGDFAQNSHRRTIFLTAAAVFLCSLLFCGAAAAADQAPFPDTGTLKSAAYTLTGDVTLSADVSVPDGVSCTIDLNGYVLKGTGSGPVITVESGGCLTLDDTSAEKTGKVTGGSAAYGGGVFVVGGTFTMNGGCITENCAETDAGGVCVVGGTFIMNGGHIEGNHAGFGGGVYIYSNSMFTMEDGYIEGNSADEKGGGVLVHTDASFVMNGGVISQNSAKYGGGVFADAGSFTLSGGTIAENSAEYGGGVYAWNNSTLSMSKGTITRNTVSGELVLGAGVYMRDTRFTMEGGSVTENSAIGTDTAGGGVFVDEGGTFIMTGGSIRENFAGNGGLYVATGAVFEVSGDVRISGNYAGLPDKTTDRVLKNVVLESDSLLVLAGKLNGEVLISEVSEKQPFEGGKFGLRREAAGADDAKQIKSDDRKLCGWFDPESDPESLKWTVDPAAGTPASPVPFAGILTGLGAAGAVLAVRMRR
ncbi:MAG TPA: right-handed parallel beta-helix repeat-containing protein [Methanocorpusculum sp.]|nr:right-handed parallel beta-helix repeat-containing protein [Methanocorpusculum sp.]